MIIIFNKQIRIFKAIMAFKVLVVFNILSIMSIMILEKEMPIGNVIYSEI